MSTFTNEQVEQIRSILAQSDSDNMTKYDQFGLCFSQMLKLARNASNGEPFRDIEFGLYISKARGIVGSIGGEKCWYYSFSSLIDKSDWNGIIGLLGDYCFLFENERSVLSVTW